jgi:hypothetical protein
MPTEIDVNNFQRVGSVSNAHAGSDFEATAQRFFASQGVVLMRNFTAPVGASDQKKLRRFDLGSENPPILVECKSHKWTQGGNSPAAKMTVWNEAMYYFYLAPKEFRKIFFVLKHSRRDISLASHYLANYAHMVPPGIEFWEYDEERGVAVQVR